MLTSSRPIVSPKTLQETRSVHKHSSTLQTHMSLEWTLLGDTVNAITGDDLIMNWQAVGTVSPPEQLL